MTMKKCCTLCAFYKKNSILNRKNEFLFHECSGIPEGFQGSEFEGTPHCFKEITCDKDRLLAKIESLESRKRRLDREINEVKKILKEVEEET